MTLPLLPSATPIKSIKYSPTTTAARENVFKATFMEDICFFTPSHSYFEWYFGPFSNKITTKGKSNSQNHFQNLKEYIRRDKLFRSFLKHSYPSVPMQKSFQMPFFQTNICPRLLLRDSQGFFLSTSKWSNSSSPMGPISLIGFIQMRKKKPLRWSSMNLERNFSLRSNDFCLPC